MNLSSSESIAEHFSYKWQTDKNSCSTKVYFEDTDSLSIDLISKNFFHIFIGILNIVKLTTPNSWLSSIVRSKKGNHYLPQYIA